MASPMRPSGGLLENGAGVIAKGAAGVVVKPATTIASNPTIKRPNKTDWNWVEILIPKILITVSASTIATAQITVE